MENIQELIRAGQKLAEKRTWLEKGYAELMGKINSELSKIPDMSEKQIPFLLREYNCRVTDCETYKRKVSCELVFEGNVFLELVLEKETHDGWEKEVLKSPSVETIRAFAKKLLEMLGFFLAEIEKRSDENQQVIDMIACLIAKLGKAGD